MKYQPTINLWQAGIQDDILSGRLKVQSGQWCRCGSNANPCRFVGVRNGIFYVAHWEGSDDKTVNSYKRLRQAFNGK